MSGGRLGMGNAPARDATLTSSASLASPMVEQAASQLSKLHSSGQIPVLPVLRASSALFNKIDVSGWVDDEAFCPAAGSTSAATALCPRAACGPWWSRAALALSRPCEGHQCFGFWGEKAVAKPAGGIFCFGCMVNSNNMSFTAQNVSTFIGCYI